MKDESIQILNDLCNIINCLDIEQYTFQSYYLAGSSIGQHTRHVIEFYECLFEGIYTGIINYENRKRAFSLETETEIALRRIRFIQELITSTSFDVIVKMEVNLSGNDHSATSITSNGWRELVFCTEHTIHHQALIKACLIELNLENLLAETSFGIAPSTVRNQLNQ